MTLGLVSPACTGFWGPESIWMLTFLGLDGEGEGLGLPTGHGTMPSLRTAGGKRRASVGAGVEWEEGGKWKFLNRKIKKENKSKYHLQYFPKKTLTNRCQRDATEINMK